MENQNFHESFLEDLLGGMVRNSLYQLNLQAYSNFIKNFATNFRSIPRWHGPSICVNFKAKVDPSDKKRYGLHLTLESIICPDNTTSDAHADATQEDQAGSLLVLQDQRLDRAEVPS